MRSFIRNLVLKVSLVLHIFICSAESSALVKLSLPSNNLYSNSALTGSFSFALNDTTSSPFQQGWTSEPNGRGTINIIWQSCTTIILCCWTVLCLNVPPSTWNQWRWLHQKILMACLGVIGPEFHFQLALGQWVSARRSVEDFKRSGYPKWSMKHAFLADMGGFVLHARDWVEFPLDAKQVHYLVVKEYVPFSAVALDMDIIADKNKSDGMVRFITVCQILWFSLNCFGRAIQHLAITTLELTTLGFIVCTVGTYFLWAHKPMDVRTAIVLEPNTTIADILIRAGDGAREPYKWTPLDFVEGRDQTSWALYWAYGMNILRKFKIVFANNRRPIEKIPDDTFPALSRRTMVLLFLSQITYAGIHLCGWNFDFPTRTERMLWHLSTVMIMVSIVSYWIVDLCTWHILPTLKNSLARHAALVERGGTEGTVQPLSESGNVQSAALIAMKISRRDPVGNVSLIAMIPVAIIAACYCFARAYILLEDFINLRSLPSTAYDTVNWIQFVPYF